ncbi:hypothetical protein K470DRAFT_220024 [Piedraia hortae CBS 480.64]|uniref:Nephrocystin 3-like N-terminal domain-containing protein n=1 Tax=Piedraia hortae CBS 480.64 TaxID=1314780 RepID=A0A6A7BVL7_9PEZI|nr:hypothetical protein K470DRAFT_220024 [Piedraia hortae CBS 480.64]
MLKTVEYHANAVDRIISQEQGNWVKQKLNTLEKAQQEINQGVQGVQQALDLSALQAAAGAAYDSINNGNADENGELQLCLENTRVQIREKILDWATTNDDQRIFWLSGKAGTGKSTIARTVADELARQGYLVGSFFFKRGRGELGRAGSLFPTIARHMADFVPSISHKIAAASKGSPPVNERALTTQFEMLIEGPLSGYKTGSATDVRAIVIDALDECEDWGAIGYAMTLWLRLRAQSSMNLRVFVTSRSDNKIGNALAKVERKDLQHERLEDWQSSTIEHDLRLFCYDELGKLREQSRTDYDELEDDWPGESVVDKLVKISKPLFIAASTIFREVSNDPREQLQEWVNRLSFAGSEGLNCIYSGILEQAAKADPKWLDQFNRIIKPIAVLLAPLTIPALTDLLGGGKNMVVPNALKPLSSVIDFPSGNEVKKGSRATVRIYHESFRDFLMNSSLKDHPEFWIDQGKVHGVLMSKCRNLLEKKLVRDVCKQKDLVTKRKDVSAEHVEKRIPESVQYACRYWVSHAIDSNEAIKDGGQVDLFLRAFLLCWTEAMAWLDKLGGMVVCLKQLQKAIDSKSSPKLHAFVADALRWVPANRKLISDTPLQTYLSALAFAPSNSVVRNTFRSEMEEFLQVWPPVATDWGFELQTLRGHTGRILSITPSIDGRRLVTVAEDNTVRLWDVESGTEEKQLKDRPRYITALALSADNKTLLCGLRDDQIRAIDLERGLLREEFPGHTERIWDIAISPDGQNFASASGDDTIRIWGPKSQNPQVLSSEKEMYGACFSADGRMLYTHDSKDCISEWDIEKACIVRTLDRGPRNGSILIDGRFVSSTFLPVVDRLAANEDDQPQTQADSSASTESISLFQGRQIWALDNTKDWITVDGRKMFKPPGQLRGYDWFSCRRTMVFRNRETGFTVLYLTGKVPF